MHTLTLRHVSVKTRELYPHEASIMSWENQWGVCKIWIIFIIWPKLKIQNMSMKLVKLAKKKSMFWVLWTLESYKIALSGKFNSSRNYKSVANTTKQTENQPVLKKYKWPQTIRVSVLWYKKNPQGFQVRFIKNRFLQMHKITQLFIENYTSVCFSPGNIYMKETPI